MYRVLLLGNHRDGADPVAEAIGRAGMECQRGADLESVFGDKASPRPEAVLLDLMTVDSGQARLVVDHCKKLRVPVVAVVLVPLLIFLIHLVRIVIING